MFSNLVQHLELIIGEIGWNFQQSSSSVFHPPRFVAGSWGFIVLRSTPRSWGRDPATLFVPRSPTGLIDRLVGQRDEMKRIDALANVGSLLVGRFLEGESHIEADRLELRHAHGTDFVVEEFQGGGVLVLVSPHGPTPLVVWSATTVR